MNVGIRDIAFGRLDVATERRGNGDIIVRSTVPLPPTEIRVTDRLAHWARAAPERTFLARREAGGVWRTLSYGEAWLAARSIASALLARGLTSGRPIVILSGNDIEHALLALGAMTAGITYAPISPAYSLMSSDFGKLKHIIGMLNPQLVFAADAGQFSKAIAAVVDSEVEIVATTGQVDGRAVTPFSRLLDVAIDDAAVDTAYAGIGPDVVAKVLFTSGSTGRPKGVMTTHGMLMANQAMLQHWLPFHATEPPVLIDWLPWNHTFGGNHNFGMVLHNGGTLYIDDGRPTPGGIAETLRNLREVSPTIYFNVPKGYEELVAALGRDEALRRTFFSRLRTTFYSGASLPRHISAELDRIAIEATGQKIVMVTGFGSTETAPASIANTVATALPGNIGLPFPGVELKLVKSGNKLEARLRGPNVMPGYWKDAEQTAGAFDDEGFYRIGDAFRFADPGDVRKGLIFDGRLSEDFKLSTGTWVSVGALRQRLIGTLQPIARDVVIAGHDRDDVTALVFPDFDACRALAPGTMDGVEALLAAPDVQDFCRRALQQMAAEATGSSTRVARIVLLAEPPSIDANEITDKGSLNQRAVLERRSASVASLYATPTPAEVIDSGNH